MLRPGRPGRLSGQRATISFEDTDDQTRRFVTPWQETAYVKGQSVAVLVVIARSF